MAADTRPFKSKEQDGQGNEIILRDQQLVEQTSQTTMASGEYFEIVDVDGRMAKIPKDNMIGVVREALGTLLNGLADQTTVTKALTLNGDTLGASTAATLASVLGVIPSGYNKRVSADLNEQLTPTFTYSSGWTNYPSGSHSSGFLEVAIGYTLNSNTIVLQRYTKYDGTVCHQRIMYNSNWSEWNQIY